MERKYQFTWDLLGNIKEGRPNLGDTVPVELYRLMQFCLRDVLETRYGSDEADAIIYQAGFLAGTQLYRQMIGNSGNVSGLIKSLQTLLRELGIGILRVENHDEQSGMFLLTISEDLECSGMPEQGFEVCTFDEGFLAAVLECALGRKYQVKEVDCWCTGDRTCRFRALPADE